MKRKTTRIDMHVHTRGSDGLGTPADIVRYAKAAKLDGVCLTDHHRTYTAESLEVARALRKAGLLAFHGAEYSTAWGHLLVYGVNVEEFGWGYYPDPRKVIRAVNRAGGLCVVAHPYHGYKRVCGDRVRRLSGAAGIEVANGQAEIRDPRANKRAVETADDYAFDKFGGSDAHDPAMVGVCYTRFDAVIQTESDLIAVMRTGSFHAVTSKKRAKEALLRRYKVLRETPVPVPLTALLPGLSLDSAPETVQLSQDGDHDRIGGGWWGNPDPTSH